MISLDLKIDYDDALIILYNPKAQLYGELLDVDEILELSRKYQTVPLISTKRLRKQS